MAKISMHDEAVRIHRRAFELCKSEHGISDELTREAAASFLYLLYSVNARETVELGNELLENTPSTELTRKPVLQIHLAIANSQIRLNQLELAIPKLRELREIVRATNDDSFLYKINYFLAFALQRRAGNETNDVDQDYAEAIELLRESLAYKVSIFGDDHLESLVIHDKLGSVLMTAGHLQEAELNLRQIIVLTPDLGADHQLTITPRISLGHVLYRQSNFVEAAKYAVEAVELQRKRGPLGSNPWAIFLISSTLPIIEAGGRFVEGEESARILLESDSSSHGPGSISNRLYLARCLSGQGKTAAAEVEFGLVEALGVRDDDREFHCLFKLFMGEHHLAKGEREKAKELFDEALSLRKKIKVNPALETFVTVSRIEDAIRRAKASSFDGK